MSKKTIEEEINEFIELWDFNKQSSFLREIIPLFELYDVDDENDWVKKEVGGDAMNVGTVRLLRTVYLMSRICEFHAGTMCVTNCKFKNLWKRMEVETNKEPITN